MTIYQPSKLDLERMSLSNNLSDIYMSKPDEVNLYSKTPHQRLEAQRTSVVSQRKPTESLPFPVSDPEFSNKKMVKNQKMKNYLEKFNQNASNKSFISLQENRELFSRKNSSMHESSCVKPKTALGPGKLGCQTKMRFVQKTSQEPKSFRFSDILEEKKSFNVAILEYPNGSQAKGLSFQSSKSVEHLLHGAALTNTKKTSFIGQEHSKQKSRFEPTFFDKYNRVCQELLESIVNETYLEHAREQELRKQKDQESRQAEQEKQRKKWGKSVRKFERQTREFLSSKQFPWKISSEEVLEFLNLFAEFLCVNKLDLLVRNINLGSQTVRVNPRVRPVQSGYPEGVSREQRHRHLHFPRVQGKAGHFHRAILRVLLLREASADPRPAPRQPPVSALAPAHVSRAEQHFRVASAQQQQCKRAVHFQERLCPASARKRPSKK